MRWISTEDFISYQATTHTAGVMNDWYVSGRVIVYIDSSTNVKVSDCVINTADCLALEVKHLDFYFSL